MTALVCDVDSWVTFDDAAGCGGFCDNLNDQLADPAVQARLDELLRFSAEWSYQRTGWLYPGGCGRVTTPVWDLCGPCAKGLRYVPYETGGEIRNALCDPCRTADQLPLFPAPVWSIQQVTVDGTELPEVDPETEATNWQVLDHRYLVRCDGGVWPNGSDPCAPRLEVAYTAGALPPATYRKVAATLARELICSCFCPTKCRLPDYWETITRDGLTMTNRRVTDDMIERALLGLDPLVDSVLTMASLPSGRPYAHGGGLVMTPGQQWGPRYGVS